MKVRIKALIASVIEFFSGGISDDVNIDNDISSLTEPTKIIEEYQEPEMENSIQYDYNTNTFVADNEVLTYDESKEIFGYALQVDVSQCNGIIDWEMLNKKVHPVSAIIRSHYISGSTFTEDSKFEENVKECAKLGLPTGVYFIPRLTQSEAEIRSEIDILVNRLKEVENKYGTTITTVAIDYEEREHVENPITSAHSISLINQLLKEQGYTTMIYSSSAYIRDLKQVAEDNNITDILNMPIWEACYLESNCYSVTNSPRSIEETIISHGSSSDEKTVAHQFTDNADASAFTEKSYGDPSDSIIDISEVIDPSFITVSNKTNNISTDEVKNDTSTETKYVSHIVEEGDTVSEICDLYGITIEEFKTYNPEITNIDCISVNQMVNIPEEKVLALINKSIENDETKEIEETKDSKEHSMNFAGNVLICSSASISIFIAIKKLKENREEREKNKFKYTTSKQTMPNYYTPAKKAR